MMAYNPSTDPGNQPERFDDMSPEKQEALLDWIEYNLIPSEDFYTDYTSFQFRGFFERRPGGFYVSNGAFKGAMLKLGFRVKDKKEVNWEFNISPNSQFFFWHEELRQRYLH